MRYKNDIHDLQKYLDAQNVLWWGCQEGKEYTMYEKALEEIRNGNKEEHWIWYIFPQIEGLGRSSYSQMYGIPGLEGAIEYLKNKTLHDRLVEISMALLKLETNDLMSVMWEIDCYKIRSCITLFYQAAVKLYGTDSEEANLFIQIRDKYFSRIGFCERTLEMLAND